jgi:excinuclease ABC subunit A
MTITHISVRGARQHNLRDINVRIPRNTLTVVTGLSGSGRVRWLLTRFMPRGSGGMWRRCRRMRGSSSIRLNGRMWIRLRGLARRSRLSRRRRAAVPRSTVGTITEIYDYLRLLYASVGTPHCPNCGKPITRQTAEQIVQRIQALGDGQRVVIMAPVVRGRKGEFRELLDQLEQQGFRARIDGELRDLAETVVLDRRKNHTIEAVIDRIVLKPGMATRMKTAKRLEASVAKALQMANGLVLMAASTSASAEKEEQLFSSSMACPDCGLDVPKLEPRSFSFNSAFGACPECHGLGRCTISIRRR